MIRWLWISCLIWLCSRVDTCPIGCWCQNKEVNCNEMRLTDIPEDIPQDATTLNLRKNNIKNINSSRLENLSSLSSLNLDGNPLTEIPADLRLMKLVTLAVAQTKLTEIQLDGANFPLLQILDFSSSLVTSVGVSTLKNLGLLYMRNLNIGSFSKPTVTLPETIRTLDLSDNILVETDIGYLTKLRRLYLRNTRLKTLPSSTIRIPNTVTSLYLPSNPITQLDISSLPNLKELDLRNCGIQQFLQDSNFKIASITHGLYLSDNPLTMLNLTDIPYLRSMELQNLHLASLSIYAPSLTWLDMKRTHLNCLSEEQLFAPNILTLDLKNTVIQSLDIRSYGKLRSLSLNQLSTTKLDKIAFTSSVLARNNLQVGFNKNSISCTCCLSRFFNLTNSGGACKEGQPVDGIRCGKETCEGSNIRFCPGNFQLLVMFFY